jgi:hypothetical protein
MAPVAHDGREVVACRAWLLRTVGLTPPAYGISGTNSPAQVSAPSVANAHLVITITILTKGRSG